MVPRLGDADRSRAILDVGAGWYGGRISWPGGGGAAGAGVPITIENHIEVGGEVVRIVRSEIRADHRQTNRRVDQGVRW
jgi:hypothetical protein